MRKEEFLGKLEYLLSGVNEEEREEALEYYRDYFEEAGPEHEEEIAAHFGSPEKVAAEIRSGLQGDMNGGEFTERGYTDERFREDYHVPDQYAEIVTASKKDDQDTREQKEAQANTSGLFGDEDEREEHQGRSYQQEWSRWRQEWEQRYERDHRSRRYQEERSSRDQSGQSEPRWWEYKYKDGRQKRNGAERGEEFTYGQEYGRNGRRGRSVLWIFLLIIFFGLPTASAIVRAGFSIIGGIFGGIFGIFAGLFGLVFGFFGAAIGLIVGGIGTIFAGIAHLASPAVGTMMIGGGFLMIAASMLVLILAKWGCTTIIPGVFRWVIGWVRSFFRWIGGLFGRHHERGGEQE